MTSGIYDECATLEEAWIVASGEIMPKAQEIIDDPFAAAKAFYFAGAIAATHLIYMRGIAELRDELKQWSDEP